MYPRSIGTLALLLLVLPFASSAMAQGTEADEPDLGKDGGFFFEFGTWVAQAAGSGLVAATATDPSNPFSTTPLGPNIGTQTEFYYNFGYEMARNQGKITVNLYTHGYDELSVGRSTPGVFRYGEVLAHPLFAGVNLDGLSDAFSADFEMSLKDKRLDYSRRAFESARITGDWFVGWRRVDHHRRTDVSYSALVPNFPPLLPPLTQPQPGLDPQDDIAQMTSDFTGRGIEAGMNFRVPLVSDFIVLEAGFAVAALRGETDVSYASTTHYYVLEEPGHPARILGPPYSEFSELSDPDPTTGNRTPLAELTQQRNFRLGLTENARSTSSMVLETYFALRWNVWKDLDIVTGFKQTRYDDVAVELRPEVTTSAIGVGLIDGELSGVNTQNFTEVSRSVTYEGFYFGVGYVF